MPSSYRTFTLHSLRTGSLAIAEKIAEHKALLQAAQRDIQRSSDRLVLLWSLGISLFLGLVLGIVFLNLYIGLAAVILLTLLAFFASRLALVSDRLRASDRYARQQRQIAQSQAAIEELHQKARAYQRHLEQPGIPGFLACFADVLLHSHYPSFFPRDDRLRFVDLSTAGRGSDIDIFDYGRLVQELQASELDDYVDGDSLVDQVVAQNKYQVAIAYAEQIAGDTRGNQDELRFAALVGLNAWHSFESQGHPLTWTTYETEQWTLVRKILQHALAGNIMTLAKTLSEYDELGRKHGKKAGLNR